MVENTTNVAFDKILMKNSISLTFDVLESFLTEFYREIHFSCLSYLNQ